MLKLKRRKTGIKMNQMIGYYCIYLYHAYKKIYLLSKIPSGT